MKAQANSLNYSSKLLEINKKKLHYQIFVTKKFQTSIRIKISFGKIEFMQFFCGDLNIKYKFA